MTPCNCLAYPFPHRRYSGDCEGDESAGFCLRCFRPCVELTEPSSTYVPYGEGSVKLPDHLGGESHGSTCCGDHVAYADGSGYQLEDYWQYWREAREAA